MKALFEEYLNELIDDVYPSSIKESIHYSLCANSKRVRPLLVLNVLKDYGVDVSLGLDAAAALEMIHTYSLIHDDLPAMDDDDYRRGVLSNHKQFDEATAILAGDALQSLAYQTLASSPLNDAQKIACIQSLAISSGANGMVLGQSLDIKGETNPLSFDEIMMMYLGKTGQLFACAMELGAICAQKTDDLPQLRRIGENLGILFQMQDDLLEVTSTAAQLGKSLSDVRHDKKTAVSIIGIFKTQEKISRIYDEIIEEFSSLSTNFIHTKKLVEYILQRNM